MPTIELSYIEEEHGKGKRSLNQISKDNLQAKSLSGS